MFSDLVLKGKKKLENAMAIFKELLLRRRKKILKRKHKDTSKPIFSYDSKKRECTIKCLIF